jgi:O-acetyl-ADP-ribose deacetylase (regulator of RNase III)/predicted RNA-binding Zn-ribbon protein involved in translation (DUF1610 family)
MSTENLFSSPAQKHRGGLRPVRAYRAWRWRRVKARSTSEAGLNRTPVEVCPKGCESTERARREVLARSRLSGRAAVRVEFTFETTNCPICGSRLMSRCARCGGPVLLPVVDRCRFCGLPHPWAAERRAGTERVPARKWHPDSPGVNDPATLLYETHLGELWVVEGDVLQLDVDAIISNDDVDGRMWTEVAYAIKQAAAGDVDREARDGAPHKIGQAWTTLAGELPLDGIVHVASMNRRGKSSEGIIQRCIRAALDCAQEARFKSIGIAAIGSGPNIPLATWLDAFAHTVVGYLHSKRQSAKKLAIVLVLYECEDFDQDVALLRRAVCHAWRGHGEPADGRPASPCPGPIEQLRELIRPRQDAAEQGN